MVVTSMVDVILSVVVVLAFCNAGASNDRSTFQKTDFIRHANKNNNDKIRVCYYSHPFVNETDIPADLCTHILVNGMVSPEGLKPLNPSGVYSWRLLVKLKQKNPNLKVLVSVGDHMETVVGKGPHVLQSFLNGTKKVLQTFDLDGVDLDWEWPRKYKNTYIDFQKALSAMLKSEGKLMSAALPRQLSVVIENYAPAAINKYFDFVTIMTYDFHTYSSLTPLTDYNSPLKPSIANIDVLRDVAGIEPSKMLLGYATYGRSWKLADPNKHGHYALATGPGAPGPALNHTGVYSIADVCLEVKKGGKIVEDSEFGAEYIYNGDTWVSFNGMYSANISAEYVRTSGLGGMAFYSIGYDDATNVCGNGRFPVFNKVKEILTRP